MPQKRSTRPKTFHAIVEIPEQALIKRINRRLSKEDGSRIVACKSTDSLLHLFADGTAIPAPELLELAERFGVL